MCGNEGKIQIWTCPTGCELCSRFKLTGKINEGELLISLKDRMDVENKYEKIMNEVEVEFDEEEPKTVEFEIGPDAF